jgi:hypothetical protein
MEDDAHTVSHFFVLQLLRVEESTGETVLDGVRTPISAGLAIPVPPGTKLNMITPVRDTVSFRRRRLPHPGNAEKDNEYFDGNTKQYR